MGIDETISHSIAQEGANLILFARTGVGKYPTKMNTKKRGTEDYQDKLKAIATNIQQRYPASKIIHKAVDVQRYEVVESVVSTCAKELGGIDILINNVSIQTHLKGKKKKKRKKKAGSHAIDIQGRTSSRSTGCIP